MYTSLHNHTYFSTLDGYSSPEEYLKRATELGLKGIAITEHGNAYSWLYFDKIKKNYPNVRMLYGVEFYEAFDMLKQDKDNKYFHLLAIARNERGRIALNRLVTISNFNGFYYKPRIDIHAMSEYADDIIVTSACLASKISRTESYDLSVVYALEYQKLFPNFYLELQSHRHEDQVKYNQKLIQIHKDTGIPFVITTDSHSATEEDLKYQEKLVQIARDDETIGEIYEGCYVQSVSEIHEIMDSQIGFDMVEKGLLETNKILDLVEEVNMPFQKPTLPHYPLPEGFDSNEEYLKHLIYLGWDKKFGEGYDDTLEEYSDRVVYEFDVIKDMGFAGYFIIVWDIISWAKENGIMVGAGRGSAGGSLVCYLLGITELDPIKYKLIFERFLNPERVSMPDIDIDFGDRDRVVEYLTNKYGEERVCQIINYSFITPVVAIKDAGRILGVPYKITEQISKRFVRETFEECMMDNPEIEKEYPEYAQIFEVASKLYGRVRNVSTHAGGVGIVDTEINNYMPMKLGTKGEHVIQADKKTSEDIGIVKFDILGISTLTLIQEIINDAGIDEWEINPNNYEFLSNKKMWGILQNAQTNGVFQVESQGMKELLLRLKPETLNDVSAVLALYRPDSIQMLEDYIRFKQNPNEIDLWHEDMYDIVKDTYGTIIFQEQLMEIVRLFAGRSMGGADLFRKAIGKKDLELVKREARKLYQEIIDNGYSHDLAIKISQYMEDKGGYMFNASHSALYAVITLQTAFLKANYPELFFKALLNQNTGDYGSINKYIVDAQEFGVEVLPPHINKSERGFSVVENKVLFGIEAIKGIGQTLSDKIVEERIKGGNYENLFDFIERTSPNVSQVVSLIKSGAIPTKNKRQYLIDYAQSLYNEREYKPVKALPSEKILLEKWHLSFPKEMSKEEKLEKYNSARKLSFESEQIQRLKKHIDTFVEKYLSSEKLWEFETLSIFLTGNPFKLANNFITHYSNNQIGEKCVLVGVVADITKKKDRNGKAYCFISLYTSHSEIIDVTFWSGKYSEYIQHLVKGNDIAVLCKITDDGRFVAEKLKEYKTWLEGRLEIVNA